MAKDNNLYVDGGGMSVHAPTVAAMSKDEFINLWLPRINWIYDERAKIKFLTGKYEECVALMNPPKYRGNVAESATDNDSKDVVIKEEEPVKVRSRKNTEKKE